MPFLHKSLGGGEQVPPAVFFFQNRDPFLHGSPGGGEQVPPAVLFFQNRDPFFKTRGHGPGAMGPFVGRVVHQRYVNVTLM